MSEKSRAKPAASGRQDAAAYDARGDRPDTSLSARGGIHSGDARLADKDVSFPGGANPEHARRAARTDCTILIVGETGVGKGYLARWIHEHSRRASEPFIPVNCGAIPETLIDSHLFGHARGAFTGASVEHIGMVRAANRGTLLLDEISEMPATAQLRLLRLLQENEVQPVGHSRPMTVNVRVIAATSVDLHQAVHAGSFREDLLYRLDVVTLTMLPLRQRVAEIAGLVDRFNEEFAAIHHRGLLQFSSEAMACLRRHSWPGNIRQVRTVVERLHVLCPHQDISPTDLRLFGGFQPRHTDMAWPSADQARLAHARDILQRSDGSFTRAADSLGVHRSTLYRWLRDDQADDQRQS